MRIDYKVIRGPKGYAFSEISVYMKWNFPVLKIKPKISTIHPNYKSLAARENGWWKLFKVREGQLTAEKPNDGYNLILQLWLQNKCYYLTSCISIFEGSIGSSCKAWLFIWHCFRRVYLLPIPTLKPLSEPTNIMPKLPMNLGVHLYFPLCTQNAQKSKIHDMVRPAILRWKNWVSEIRELGNIWSLLPDDNTCEAGGNWRNFLTLSHSFCDLIFDGAIAWASPCISIYIWT